MAFLFQRKIGYNKIWYIGYYHKSPEGKLIRKNISTKEKSKTRANLILSKFNQDRSAFHVTNRITLSDFLKKYLQLTGPDRKHRTNKNIENNILLTIKILGNRYLDDYSAEDFDSFFTGLVNQNKSKYTVKNYRSDLRAAYQQAIRWGYIKSNPIDMTRQIKTPEPDIIPFTREEFAIFQQVASKPFREIAIFTLHTGLRAGDVVSIKLSDIDIHNRIITIGNEDHTSKNQRTNFVEIPDAIMDLVKEKLMTNQNYLFEHKKYVNPRKFEAHTVSNEFKRIIRKSNLNPRLNHKSLRKSFACWLYEEGIPITEISRLLHHSSPAVTLKHYAKIFKGKYTGITNKISFL